MSNKIYNQEVKSAFDYFRNKMKEGIPVEVIEKMIDDYKENPSHIAVLLNHADSETIKDCMWIIKEKLDKEAQEK